MKDPQNDFYSSISKYYHEIFPYNPAQLQFVVRQMGGIKGKRILDIGSATGELAYELAKEGAEVTGIDLNEDLLLQARSGKVHPALAFENVDMLNVKEVFHPRQFDAVVCFGNTLVHLPSEEQVKKLMIGVAGVLKPGGIFLLQILNYDYILEEGITGLPVIETGNIKFVRKYDLQSGSRLIGFKTELHIKHEDKVIVNETPLLALKSKALVRLLGETDFENVKLYSSFKEEEFGGKHLPLVARAFLKL